MDDAERERLKAKGWVETTVSDFLGLTPLDETIVELRVDLAGAVRRRREAAGLTQGQLAGRIESNQPRVAKIEANQPGVSLDQLVAAFLATGATRAELAEVIAGAPTDGIPMPRPADGKAAPGVSTPKTPRKRGGGTFA